MQSLCQNYSGSPFTSDREIEICQSLDLFQNENIVLLAGKMMMVFSENRCGGSSEAPLRHPLPLPVRLGAEPARGLVAEGSGHA